MHQRRVRRHRLLRPFTAWLVACVAPTASGEPGTGRGPEPATGSDQPTWLEAEGWLDDVPQAPAQGLAPAAEPDLQAAVRRVLETASARTVALHLADGTGSGVWVRGPWILTARHVVGSPTPGRTRRLTVYFPDGGIAAATTVPVSEWPAEPHPELSWLRLLGERAAPEPLVVAPEAPAAGSWVLAMGHPGGYQAQRPIASRLGRVEAPAKRAHAGQIQSTAPLLPGDSGGPLFDLEGRVVGIHSRVGGTALTNFHVDTTRALQGMTQVQGPARPAVPEPPQLPASASAAVASVEVDGRPVALATRVAPGRFVMPAGALPAEADLLLLRLARRADAEDRRALVARVEHLDRRAGLATLVAPVERTDDLPPASVFDAAADADTAAGTGPGDLLVSAGPGPTPLAVSLASTAPVRVPSGAVLGVVLAHAQQEATVRSVAAGHALRRGDTVIGWAGRPLRGRDALEAAVAAALPGDAVLLDVVDAAGTRRQVEVVLREGQTLTRHAERVSAASGRVSRRRSGFERAVIHDAVLPPHRCGGPVYGSDGRFRGINLARVDRTTTLLLPTDALATWLSRLP